MKKIVIACVNYHHANEVIQYVKHVRNQNVSNLIDIVVTDNSEDDHEFHHLQEKLHRDCYLFQANKNLGYIHGIDYGLKQYLKRNHLPEWIVMSNTDIQYEDQTFYEKLLSYYPNGYDCVVAPCIYSVENKFYQNPLLINRYSKIKLYVLMNIFRYNLLEMIFNHINQIKNHFQLRKKTILPNQEIYSGHGACLILNKQYFVKGGDLNYGSFLFGEELYISEIVKKLGGCVYYDNRLKVNHLEHSTIRKEKRKKINRFYYHSMKYLYKKFY